MLKPNQDHKIISPISLKFSNQTTTSEEKEQQRVTELEDSAIDLLEDSDELEAFEKNI